MRGRRWKERGREGEVGRVWAGGLWVVRLASWGRWRLHARICFLLSNSTVGSELPVYPLLCVENNDVTSRFGHPVLDSRECILH